MTTEVAEKITRIEEIEPDRGSSDEPRPLKQWSSRRNKYYPLKLKLFLRVLKQRKISWRKVWIVIWSTLAYHLKLTRGAPAPYILSIETWNECNAGCLFCRTKNGKIYDLNPKGSSIAKGKMPPEMAMEIIRQWQDDVLITVLYTNGEPLLYKELPKVIKFATDHRMATLISSNGLLFTKENARTLLEAGLDCIKIQLSGYTQDVYSIQIRYGNVERLKENIRMLAEMNEEGGYGTVIMIDYILYNYNRHQMELVKGFCKGLGLMINMRPGNPSGGLEKIEPALIDKEKLPLKVSCDYLWKVMQVNWNGDILPCCEAVVWSGAKPYETFKIGQTDVKRVWRSHAAISMREMMAIQGRKVMPMCRQCTRKGVCFKW